METVEWIKFIVGSVFFLIGLVIFGIEMIGVFRFKYVLNRMHAAAMGDTMGIGSCFLGLIIMSGWNFTSLKLFLVVVFLWFASPTASHLIARLEVTTNEDKTQHYRKISLIKNRKAVQTTEQTESQKAEQKKDQKKDQKKKQKKEAGKK